MSRRLDRKKPGKEKSATRKDESDAAILPSSDFAQLRSMPSGRPVEPHASLFRSGDNVNTLHLVSESVHSETKEADGRFNVREALKSLETKINVLLEKSGLADSSDKENLELQAEMQKLYQATVKQKDDFNQLLDIVRRQKETLKKLESMANMGRLRKPIASALDSREVDAVQCCHDLETRTDLDAMIVFLIGGRYEYRRKVSQSSDEAVNVYIPDSVNTGSRMLPGRQSFPNNLLKSLTFDAPPPSMIPNTPTLTVRPRTSGVGSVLGAEAAGPKELAGSRRTCPICNVTFPTTETLDAFELHVQRHFVED